MLEQISKESYQTVFDNPLVPKRITGKVVKRLNEKNLKSVNGGEYNYTKVWQVLRGRWADIQVEIAYEEIMKEERSQIQKLKELRNQN